MLAKGPETFITIFYFFFFTLYKIVIDIMRRIIKVSFIKFRFRFAKVLNLCKSM